MNKNLFHYLFVFLSIFGLNQLILFVTIAFVAWSFNPLFWGEVGRGGFYVLTIINLLLSGILSSFLTVNGLEKK